MRLVRWLNDLSDGKKGNQRAENAGDNTAVFLKGFWKDVLSWNKEMRGRQEVFFEKLVIIH